MAPAAAFPSRRRRAAKLFFALTSLAAAVQGQDATAAPTANATAERPYPGKLGTVPADQVCTQPLQPPGVKPGSCLETICYPDGIQIDGPVVTTVRYCLQRPRLYDGTFVLLDRINKAYFTGTGFQSNGTQQCGEHTYQLDKFAVKTASPTNATYDIMWKYFFLPVWGTGENNRTQDQFPNMLAEAGIPQQPPYTGLVNQCPVKANREWILPPTGQQDAITFKTIPTCLVPGKPWSIDVYYHLESVKKADLRVNLQIGTGGDKYLGPEDIYVTESNIYGIKGVNATLYNYTSPAFYTKQTVLFTANQTSLLSKGDRVYAAAFMVPFNSTFGPNGWDILEREFITIFQNSCPP